MAQLSGAMRCCRPAPVRLRDLRHLATIQQRRTEEALENDHGEIDWSLDANWSTYLDNVYVAIRPARASEQIVSEQLTGVLTHVLITRFNREKLQITPSMRIKLTRHGLARILHVAGPVRNLDEADQWLEIPCIEEVRG